MIWTAKTWRQFFVSKDHRAEKYQNLSKSCTWNVEQEWLILFAIVLRQQWMQWNESWKHDTFWRSEEIMWQWFLEVPRRFRFILFPFFFWNVDQRTSPISTSFQNILVLIKVLIIFVNIFRNFLLSWILLLSHFRVIEAGVLTCAAGLAYYGTCQMACNAGYVVCMIASGLVAGTTGPVGWWAWLTSVDAGCSSVQGTCMAACSVTAAGLCAALAPWWQYNFVMSGGETFWQCLKYV